LLNAGYGAYASPYFRYYDIRLAKAITYTSQLAIKWIMKYVSKNIYNINVIYSDTDSMYLSVHESFKKLCIAKNLKYESLTFDEKRDLISKYIEPKILSVIEQGYEELAKNLNVIENTFLMKRELIGDSGIWLAKKSYCIKMIDKEGVPKNEKDKPYVKGFEIAKKSSNSKWIVDTLIEYLELLFKGNKTIVTNFEKKKFSEFKELPANDFFGLKNVSSLNKYSDINGKSVQAHIRGALSYNRVITEQKLESSFPLIHQDDKIHWCYVAPGNKLGTNCIAFLDGVDGDRILDVIKKEYRVEIDYKKQWETIFMSPARRLTNALDWVMIDTGKTNIMSLLRKK
jgi:hypothetical protein